MGEVGLALTFTNVSREAMLILRCVVAQYEELRTFQPHEYLERFGEKQHGPIV